MNNNTNSPPPIVFEKLTSVDLDLRISTIKSNNVLQNVSSGSESQYHRETFGMNWKVQRMQNQRIYSAWKIYTKKQQQKSWQFLCSRQTRDKTI